MADTPDIQPELSTYALIGDCHSTALVGLDGSIDWACLRHFDGSPVFARLLDPKGGTFLLRAKDAHRVSRRYLPGTNVLETTFTAPNGTLCLQDSFAMREGGDRAPFHQLLRAVECLEGEAATFIQLHGSSVDKERQGEPHGHSVNLTKNNKFMLGADLGTDKVMIYKIDPAKATMTANNPAFAMVKAGSGPRHLVVAPDQKHVYVLSEMGSLLTTFDLNADTGVMKEIDAVTTLPADFKGQSAGAEIQIDAKGQHIYTSNRGHDSISVFDVDAKTAKPKMVQAISTGGVMPRAFVIDPSGNFIVAGNQKTNTITTFRIDHGTGKLTFTGEKIDLGAPVTFVFLK